MQVMKTVVIPARNEERCVRRVCDLCGAEGKNAFDGADFEVKESECSLKLRLRTGQSYPEGGSGEEIQVDICPKCFKTKLVPWLQSQGAKIESKEWDW